MKKLVTTLALCLAAATANSAIRPYVNYDIATLTQSPSNLLSSNILAGTGVSIVKDSEGRLTISSTGGAGATNNMWSVQFSTNGMPGTNRLLVDAIGNDQMQIYDDFWVPNTTNGGLYGMTTPQGYHYDVDAPYLNGTSNNIGRVEDGYLKVDPIPNPGASYSNGLVYLKMTTTQSVTHVGQAYKQVEGNGGIENSSATIGVSRGPSFVNQMLHFNVNRDGGVLTITTNFPTVPLTNVIAKIVPVRGVIDGQRHTMFIEKVGNNMVSIGALGTNLLVHHPWVNQIWTGTNFYWEFGASKTNLDNSIDLDAVWAGSARFAIPDVGDEFYYTENLANTQAQTNPPSLKTSTNLIASKPQKVTPVNSDRLMLADSAAGFSNRYFLWSDLPGAGSGEVNVATNIAPGGVTDETTYFDLVEGKRGVTNYFKTISEGNNISVTKDAETNLSLNVVPAGDVQQVQYYSNGVLSASAQVLIETNVLVVTNFGHVSIRQTPNTMDIYPNWIGSSSASQWEIVYGGGQLMSVISTGLRPYDQNVLVDLGSTGNYDYRNVYFTNLVQANGGIGYLEITYVSNKLVIPHVDANPDEAGNLVLDTNETGGSVLKFIGGDGYTYYVVATTNTPSNNDIPKFDSGIGRYGNEADGGAGGGGTNAAGFMVITNQEDFNIDTTFQVITNWPHFTSENFNGDGATGKMSNDLAGYYTAKISVSSIGEAGSPEYEVALFTNDVQCVSKTVRNTSATDSGVVALFSWLYLPADTVLDIRAKSDDGGGANFDVTAAQFLVEASAAGIYDLSDYATKAELDITNAYLPTNIFNALIASPAAGQVMVYDSTYPGWTNGALDLADTDAVTGLLPDGNIASTIARDSELATESANILQSATNYADAVGVAVLQSATNYTDTEVAAATNNLSGDAVTAGTVAEARIHADIARDAELAASTNLNTGTGPHIVRSNAPAVWDMTLLSTPSVTNFTDAMHDHSDAVNGGALGRDLTVTNLGVRSNLVVDGSLVVSNGYTLAPGRIALSETSGVNYVEMVAPTGLVEKIRWQIFSNWNRGLVYVETNGAGESNMFTTIIGDGSDGEVLTMSSGTPAWAAAGAADGVGIKVLLTDHTSVANQSNVNFIAGTGLTVTSGTTDNTNEVTYAIGASVVESNAPTIHSPTIGTPTIAADGWANATHAHTSAATGGDLDSAYATDSELTAESANILQASTNYTDTEVAAATNSLSGDAISGGTVADARIAGTLTRDSELVTESANILQSATNYTDTEIASATNDLSGTAIGDGIVDKAYIDSEMALDTDVVGATNLASGAGHLLRSNAPTMLSPTLNGSVTVSSNVLFTEHMSPIKISAADSNIYTLDANHTEMWINGTNDVVFSNYVINASSGKSTYFNYTVTNYTVSSVNLIFPAAWVNLNGIDVTNIASAKSALISIKANGDTNWIGVGYSVEQ